MSVTDKYVCSWDELVACLQKFRTDDGTLACRGQTRAYEEGVKAKIDRCLKPDDLTHRMRMERAVCQRFREHAPTYLSDVEGRYLFQSRWLQLVVMQHFGAPTRLLDWTKSPWIAAYFAAFGDWGMPGYIYIFPRARFEQKLREGKFGAELDALVWGPHDSRKGFSSRAWDRAKGNDCLFDESWMATKSRWVATFYSREAHFPRLIAQQGLFTFASQPDTDHWGFIRSLTGDGCFEIGIDHNAKTDILKGLANMGLTGATLFPGADGIGSSLEGFARTRVPPEYH